MSLNLIEIIKKYSPILAILVSVSAAFISYKIHSSLLPISQANVLVSEDSIDIYWPSDNSMLAIVPKLKNIGKASAQEIRFKVFVIPLINIQTDSSSTSYKLALATTQSKSFDDFLPHDLEPDQVATFGSIQQSKYVDFYKNGEKTKTIDLQKERGELLLIYHLQYRDTISFWKGSGEIFNKFYFFVYYFKHDFGPDEVMTLIGDEYLKNKDGLIEYLKESKNSPELLEHLLNNPVVSDEPAWLSMMLNKNNLF